MAIEAPTADLVAANDILDEENPVAGPQTKLVKEFNVLEKIVIASTGGTVLVVVSVDKQLHFQLQGLLLLLSGDHPILLRPGQLSQY